MTREREGGDGGNRGAILFSLRPGKSQFQFLALCFGFLPCFACLRAPFAAFQGPQEEKNWPRRQLAQKDPPPLACSLHLRARGSPAPEIWKVGTPNLEPGSSLSRTYYGGTVILLSMLDEVRTVPACILHHPTLPSPALAPTVKAYARCRGRI